MGLIVLLVWVPCLFKRLLIAHCMFASLPILLSLWDWFLLLYWLTGFVVVV